MIQTRCTLNSLKDLLGDIFLQAALYYRKVLQQRAREGKGEEERRDNADALIFLARYSKACRTLFIYCFDSLHFLLNNSKNLSLVLACSFHVSNLTILQRHGELEDCEKYCNRLLDIGGTVKDEAKCILTEVREISRSLEGKRKRT